MADDQFLWNPTPNEEAARFINGKSPVSRQVFDGLLPELRARAFTISGIEDHDVLQGVRDTLADLPQGGDWSKIKEKVLSQISPWLVTARDPDERAQQLLAAQQRANLLVRVHGMQAYGAAAYRDLDEQRDIFTFWKYQSMDDARVRGNHAALDGIILPHDSPFWQKHFPPWEFGCRCTVVAMLPEEVDEIRAAEKRKPKAERQVIEGDALRRLEEEGIIIRNVKAMDGSKNATTYSVRAPSELDPKKGYRFDPGGMTLDVRSLEKRYDSKVWGKWQEWAKRTGVDGLGANVWEWLSGEGKPAKKAAAKKAAAKKTTTKKAAPRKKPAASAEEMVTGTPASPKRAAKLLAREPNHRAAKALKTWGDDEQNFGKLIKGKGKKARQWQADVAEALQGIKPMPGKPTVFRGWNFKTAADRKAFLESNVIKGTYSQQRVGMSCTKELKVAARSKFLNQHGMIWEIRKSRTARDVEDVFKALGAKYPDEKEAIMPKGAGLVMVGKPKRKTVDAGGGKKKRVWYYVFEEESP